MKREEDSSSERETRKLIFLARNAMQIANLAEAYICYRKALLLEPYNEESVHYYGVLLVENTNVNVGIKWLTRSLHLNFRDKLKLTNRAIALQRIGSFQDAKSDLLEALNIDPEYDLALLNLGHVYKDLKQYSDAGHSYEKVITFRPDLYPPYDHLTYCYSYPEQLDRRVESARRAHNLNPLNPDCAYNFSLYCLMTGRFAEGWDLSRSRWHAAATQDKSRYSQKLALDTPEFELSNPEGPVLIWAEQGLGDEIMFLSILPDLLDQAAVKLMVQVDIRMLPIWKRSFPTVEFLERQELPKYSSYRSQLPAGDLPILFRRSKDDFLAAGGAYLRADHARYQKLSMFVQSYRKPVIGIGWYSRNGSTRRIPLIDLIKVLSQFDFILINLQYGDTTQEVAAVEDELGTQVFLDTGINCESDLDGLAALMKSCDLVISIANATVHLAGALGVKTWGLLPFFPGWRWFSDSDTSLWYRSVKLIHQKRLSDWSSVYAELERRLRHEFP